MTTAFSHPHLSDAELADIWQQMRRFAQIQLKDDGLADDVVQDALIKTLTHADSFKGQSAYKSWVFAILKNTIVDTLRKRGREVQLSSLAAAHTSEHDDVAHQSLVDTLFEKDGHWQKVQRPARWHTPEESVENGEFWQVLELCLSELPTEQARVFMMREYMELDTGEICEQCDISSSKFYVVMHRVRLKLQTCLSVNWFDNQGVQGVAHA